MWWRRSGVIVEEVAGTPGFDHRISERTDTTADSTYFFCKILVSFLKSRFIFSFHFSISRLTAAPISPQSAHVDKVK